MTSTTTFEIVVGDITRLKVDAIVNAANAQLLAGGGVCGAIHKAAGRDLEAECLERFPNGISAGNAVVTSAYNLPARFVVHAVPPKFFETGAEGIDTLLAAYRESMREADAAKATSIALPSLGTGIYGWVVENVAQSVIGAILGELANLKNVERVTLCCFSDEDAARYGEALEVLRTDDPIKGPWCQLF
jgi:O-acetyl-ADP-ribose deacetylase (regulator of RNase III)